MHRKMGVWLDHRKAIIVAISEEGEEARLVISGVEKQLRRSGDSPMKGPYESLRVPADDSRQRAFAGHLNMYYDAVIASLHDAEAVLVFGPGEAKGELKRRLERVNLGGIIVAMETVDKMTDRQIAAKVRQRFPTRSKAKTETQPAVTARSRRGQVPRQGPDREGRQADW